MHYTVKTAYTREDFIGFMQAYTARNKKIKGLDFISQYGTKAGSALMLFGGFWNIFTMYRSGEWDTKMIIASIALAAIGIAMSLIPVDELAGRRTWKNYPLQGMVITYDFDAGCFTETRQGNEYKHNYSDIKALYTDGERYYLFINENSAFIICKRAFIEGDPEAFAKYIENKTDLKMEIKGVRPKKEPLPKPDDFDDDDEDWDEDEEE